METIPNEFETWADYTKAFRNPTLEEIWHQIHLGMDTISKGLYVESYEKKPKFIGRNQYNIRFNVPTGKDIPIKGDLMLLSKRELQSRKQIINDGSFCAILVVMSTPQFYRDYVASMDVCLSQSPYEDNLNQQSSYQVTHLANLITYECCWEIMTRDSKESSEVINLILSRNDNGVCTDISLSLNLRNILHFLIVHQRI